MTAASRRRIVALFLVGLLGSGAVAALGFWTVPALYDSGSHALAHADSLSAPTGPTATANGNASITVGWTLPASQLAGAQYKVTRTAGPGSPVAVCTVASNITSCQDTGLAAGTSYSYSIGAALQGWLSSTVTASATTTASSAPTVTSTSPSARGRGAANQNITVTGANFLPGAAVTFSASGITVHSTSFVSTTQLTANVTLSATATLGAGNVTVTNLGGGTGSCTNCFTVTAAPTVTSVDPGSADKNAGYTGIKILGGNFVSGAVVTFTGGGITVTGSTFVNAGEITVSITIASNASQSARNVTVTNPDAGVGTGSSVFTVTN